MDKWLNPDTESSDTSVPTTTAATSAADDDEAPFATPATPTKAASTPASPTAAKAKGKDSVEQAFDDLFNS